MSSPLTSEPASFLATDKRVFRWPSTSTCLLLAVAVAALVLRVVVSNGQRFSYDGWWHIWIATQDNWKNAVAEYRGNAHPPLFYLIIRFVHMLFGGNSWYYRICTIVPGAVATFLVGLIVRKLSSNTPLAILTAAAFGFARNPVEISTDIRTYSLCLCFVLLAFYFYLDYVNPTITAAGVRPLAGFSMCAALAIASEYYAILFVISCLLIVAVLTLVSSAYRQALAAWTSKHKLAVLAALAFPFGVLQYLYRTHIALQPKTGYNHILEFYWDPTSSESAISFLIRNGQIVWNTFTLVPAHRQSVFIALLFVTMFISGAALIWLRRDSTNSLRPAIPFFVLLTILVELMAFSLLRKYPFGGLMRQQSIIMPFVFIVTGLVCEALTRSLPKVVRTLLVVIVGMSLLLNFRSSWPDMSLAGWDAAETEFNDFAAHSAAADGALLDGFNLIMYYAHTYDSRWKFDKRVNEPPRFIIYRTSSPAGRDIEVVRTLDWWNFDFNKPEFYSNVVSILHTTHIHHLAVFCNIQGVDQFTPAIRQKLLQDASSRAREAGLHVDTLTTIRGEVTAVFSLERTSQ